jgi:predicted DNA-binding WGR domain protein
MTFSFILKCLSHKQAHALHMKYYKSTVTDTAMTINWEATPDKSALKTKFFTKDKGVCGGGDDGM